MNEIVEALRLSQVELAVLEGAPGEFAGLGSSHIRNYGNGGKQCGQHRAAAMDVKFGDILAGRAARPRKPQHHRIVDRLAHAVMKEPAAGLPRRRQLARQRRQHQAGAWPGDAHHRERAWRTAGRQRKDGLVSRIHGLFVRLKAKRQTSVRQTNRPICCTSPAAKPMLRCNKFANICCKNRFQRNKRRPSITIFVNYINVLCDIRSKRQMPHNAASSLQQSRTTKKGARRRPSIMLHCNQVFIESKNSELLLVERSLSSRKSIPSIVPIGFRMRRSTYIFFRTTGSVISSSLRVPEREMSIAGKVRLSETLRSRISSELPVPLNSSKMTSSMRLPVSTSAVAMMVSEPPSSMLRAAPKNRFGRCNALASTPPVSTLPDDGTTVL